MEEQEKKYYSINNWWVLCSHTPKDTHNLIPVRQAKAHIKNHPSINT